MAKTTHSARFKTLQERYNRGGCTKEQLRQFTGYNVITEAEYKEITGEDFKQ